MLIPAYKVFDRDLSCRGYQFKMGDQGAASATGDQGAAMATGPDGRVKGEIDGIDLYARELSWDFAKGQYVRLSAALGLTGQGGIKAGVWCVCKAGQLIEAE